MNIPINIEKLNKDSKLVAAYIFFKKKINELRKKINTISDFDILNSLSFLEVAMFKLEANPSENPQKIFENINSTGKPLRQSDLIRNLILFSCDISEQKRYYETYWCNMERDLDPKSDCAKNLEDFLMDFLCVYSCKAIMSVTNYYGEFKKRFKDILENKDSFEELLKDIKLSANQYSYIIGTHSYYDKEINELLESLRAIGITAIYPLVLYLLVENAKNPQQFTINQLYKCLRVIVSYIYRKSICNKAIKDTKSIAINIISCLKENKLKDGFDYYYEILNILCTNNFHGFPSENVFHKSFVNSKFVGKSLKYTISKIINHRSPYVTTDKFEIEHIMPQNLSPEWETDLGQYFAEIHKEYVDKIGNITLLLSNENKLCSNKSFLEKMELFKESDIILNRRISERFKTWGETSISEMSEYYFDIACKLWPLPDEYNRIITKNGELDCNVTYSLDNIINITNYKPETVSIIDSEKISITNWNDFLPKIVEKVKSLKPYELENLLKNENRESRFISTSEDFAKCVQLADGIYFNNYIATGEYHLRCCVTLAKELGISKEVNYMIRASGD